MKIKTNGIEVNYAIHGNSGPWVTFSHSLACNLHAWDAQAKALSSRYRVLAYDSRGHGESGAPAGVYTLEQMADDLKGLLVLEPRLRRPSWLDRAYFAGLRRGWAGLVATKVYLTMLKPWPERWRILRGKPTG